MYIYIYIYIYTYIYMYTYIYIYIYIYILQQKSFEVTIQNCELNHKNGGLKFR